jgi:hypothetical protein
MRRILTVSYLILNSFFFHARMVFLDLERVNINYSLMTKNDINHKIIEERRCKQRNKTKDILSYIRLFTS